MSSSRYFVPQSVIVHDKHGKSHRLVAGVGEYPDELATHDYAKAIGVKSEADMTDDDRAAVAALQDSGFVHTIDNRPESDVARTSAADARDLVAAAPGTPPNAVGTNADAKTGNDPVASSAVLPSPAAQPAVKLDDKPAVIVTTKNGK